MKQWLLFCGILFFSFGINTTAVCQSTLPKDYFNKEVKARQLKTTQKILGFLEAGFIDSVFNYTDTSYYKSNSTLLRNGLEQASKQIRQVKTFAKKSDGLIVFEEGHNVFRCIYYDDKNDYQLVDIHFLESVPDSPAVKFAFKDAKVLMQEKKEREKNINDIPPPPPPGD